MNQFAIALIPAIVLLLLFVFLFVKAAIDKAKLIKRYSRIIDVEKERENILTEIKSISKERDNAKAEFLSKKESLTTEYNKAHQVYEKLQKEISLLEESLEMTEFGIYKPHFDFGTSDKYRSELDHLNDMEKEMIKAGSAIVCDAEWTVSGSKAEGKKMTKQNHKLMLRAFNGECDAALAKVRWDNAVKMEERIRKAFETINKSGEVNRSHITNQYLDLKLDELRLTFEYQEKIKQEKDEQRQIQEEMREEEKARREIERAKEEAEKEEARYQKALEKAREDAQKASGDKLDKLNDKVKQLEEQLKAAQDLKERAISRAQITKSGHVYIISNIGSFGENVFKIGMTRRLEPLDRVKELGDASVPFPFDVHAIAYSENAPELENRLHKQFETNRLNLINNRKEFFSIDLDRIESWAQDSNIDLRLTKIAEARDYRESLAIRAKGNEAVIQAIKEEVPQSIDSLFAKDED